MIGYDWNYSIERTGNWEFGQREPRVSVAHEAIADETRFTRAVDINRAVTVVIYNHINIHIDLSNFAR